MSMDRRSGAERGSRGRAGNQPTGAPAPPPVTPLTIITSVTVLQWVRADLGVVISTGVSGLADQSGNGNDFSQGTGSAQPLYTATDATLGNLPTITGDGANDTLLNTTMANGDGKWMSGIIKTVTWAANRAAWAANAAPLSGYFLSAGTTPNLAMYGGTVTTNVNTVLPVGTWGRAEMHFNGASSYLKLLTATISGGNPGTATSVGCALFSATGVAFGNFALAERVVCSGKPTAGEITALDAYYTSRYGVGLV